MATDPTATAMIAEANKIIGNSLRDQDRLTLMERLIQATIPGVGYHEGLNGKPVIICRGVVGMVDLARDLAGRRGGVFVEGPGRCPGSMMLGRWLAVGGPCMGTAEGPLAEAYLILMGVQASMDDCEVTDES